MKETHKKLHSSVSVRAMTLEQADSNTTPSGKNNNGHAHPDPGDQMSDMQDNNSAVPTMGTDAASAGMQLHTVPKESVSGNIAPRTEPGQLKTSPSRSGTPPAASQDTNSLSLSTKHERGMEEQDTKNSGSDNPASSPLNDTLKASKRRKKVGSACVYCRRSHMNCDDSRPCKRCIKRNIGHLCHDSPPKSKSLLAAHPHHQKKSNHSSNAPHTLHNNRSSGGVTDADKHSTVILPNQQQQQQPNQLVLPSHLASIQPSYSSQALNILPSSAALNQQPFFYSEHAGSEFNSLTEFLSMIDDNDMMDSINLTNDPMLQKLEATNYIPGLSSSMNLNDMNQTYKANQELNISNDNISNTNISKLNQYQLSYLQNQLSQQQKVLQQQQQLDSNIPHLPVHNGYDNHSNTNGLNSFTNNPNNSMSTSNNNGAEISNKDTNKSADDFPQAAYTKTPNLPNSQYFVQKSPSNQRVTSTTTPHISDTARDKFFLTAADPTTEISPEERLKQVINAKLEAGLLKPYNYAKGYQRLQTYMDKYMATSSRARILKPLSTFRPGFRAIAKTLKDIDLILVEESFERMLLDYDRVFTSMAIPACLWRRTGEIYRGNKEFASLVDVSIEDLKNGKLTIYELMTEESSVNFWEKYGSIAFDKTQKAVLTSCNLRTKDGRKKKNCCFSFTIRRDRYNIPSCIVGNFIPIR